MPLELVKETSDLLYPHANRIRYGRPGNALCRAEVNRAFGNMLRVIDAHDYKLIENSYGFDLLFKHKIDDVHHDKFFMEKLNAPDSNTFKILSQKSESVSAYFTQLAKTTGLADKVSISVEPETQFVIVKSDSLSDYFRFWRSLPDTTRMELKIA